MVNVLLITVILILVADEPLMGNAGLYVFGYLFVSQTPVNGEALASRCALALLLWLACSAVLLHKHHGKFQNVRLYDMLAAFSVSSAKGLWQIRLSAGVAMALLIGELAGLPRGVWVGYACMSVLLPFGEAGTSLPMRALQRIGGVVVGSLLYAGFSLVVPAGSRILFGPIAGICMGFPSKYMVNNALNCFGAPPACRERLRRLRICDVADLRQHDWCALRGMLHRAVLTSGTPCLLR
ncbi:FUSC family protein [Bifidobacterium pseudolongum]|uniref:FUSC family protein n=1 Tax=Bifidobacterium pseudolongum TaxID=1694 RepID=UPI000529D76F|nr:FUSC family protein [Bifidobacterium pseudolongum]UNP90776.1 FUSC family protein [Bifidobacterium pseudolongum subsp. pseudolongum]WCA41516.1 FUSC family protein [Bifidobacterium pseudolongum subsp. pseudolongum]